MQSQLMEGELRERSINLSMNVDELRFKCLALKRQRLGAPLEFKEGR